MRSSALLTIGVAALTAGCSLIGDGDRVARPAVFSPPEPASQEWMLIRPPDNAAAVRLVELVRHLPDDRASFPAGRTNGLPEAEREGSLLLFREIKTQPSAQESAWLLADRLVEKDAPRSEWQHVRLFRSQGHCEETRLELQEVTRELRMKIAYEPGMLLNDLQFLWLEQSFAASDCVPLDEVVPAQTG
jgi:hypothetical protein